MTTITPLPPSPSRDDPANFSVEADAFLGALPTFVTETNTVAAEVIANRDLTEGYKNSAVAQVGLAADQVALAAVQVGLAEDQVALAAVQVGLAEDQVTLAQGQVTLATNQANAAAASAAEAAVLNEKYQGALSSDPVLDKGGNPITEGDWYVNTATGLVRAYNGSAWVNSVNVAAGVASLNSKVGDLTLKTINGEELTGVGNIDVIVPLGKPSVVAPINAATGIMFDTTVTLGKPQAVFNGDVYGKYQISTTSDFAAILGETSWTLFSTSTITTDFSAVADLFDQLTTYYIRAVAKTTVDLVEYTTYSPVTSFTTNTEIYRVGYDIDGLSELVSIQQVYNPATTYALNDIVIVKKGTMRILEYKSLANANVGNNPETSPASWSLVIDDKASTSGYFGEIPGSACVVDKGEWLSTTTYAIGDMVVVKNIPAPLKQSDLTAYVAKTANTNKPPASNPSDWEQRNALPTGTSLAQTLGIGNITPEVLINNNSGWLKFIHQGKIKYIAKKPFMHTVSWNDIAKAEAVYGNRTVRIGSRLFRVSLLTGAEADPTSWTSSSTATDNKGAGSEWNALVYRVHTDVPTNGASTYHGGKQVGSNWMNFSNADIVVTTGSGRGTLCRETVASNTANRVSRGYGSLSSFNDGTSSTTNTGFGWRPVLTLIQEPELDANLYNSDTNGPGPTKASLQYDPITDTGYYGEVTSAQFYTGTQISTATGVTAGTLQNDTEGWLKFYWHGQVLFIAKKTYRSGLSWDNINTANSVYGVNLGSTGKKTIAHAGSSTSYDVKLMKGAIKDPSPASGGGRQWDELLYRVCTGTETGEIGANWATLSPSTDLGINSSNGSFTLCQEVYQSYTANRVNRGGASLSGFDLYPSSNTYTFFGWRPCLALVR